MRRTGTLVAGPFAGELGWELCAWNPRVRRLAEEFERTVVLTRAERAPLYEFASRVVPIEVAPDTSEFVFGELVRPAPAIEADARLLPTRELVRAEQLAFDRDPMAESAKCWRLLGNLVRPAPADVCLALRPPKLLRGMIYTRREYPEERGVQLAELLAAHGYRLACIGGAENRLVPGALDLRGAPLAVQMDALANALVAVGPSSGPLHLAHLCGCAVVTWYDAMPGEVEASRARYVRGWNPWGAPIRHLGGLPTAAAAAAAALELAVRVGGLRAAG